MGIGAHVDVGHDQQPGPPLCWSRKSLLKTRYEQQLSDFFSLILHAIDVDWAGCVNTEVVRDEG